MIGSLGDVIFVATAETIRTLDEFVRKSAGRWAKHEVLGRKPLSQWIGPGLDTVSFTMRFDVFYGVNPRNEMNKLLELERSGKSLDLIIGGKAVGMDQWVITSLEQKWERIDSKGNVLAGTASLSLEEYMRR
ncbi:phage tail protein [Brevibacillus porteri]|uniref:phage tail protein n=1 Tax=Brevibacillus porteri TaxID=2126350 RepID=UPI003D1BB8C6